MTWGWPQTRHWVKWQKQLSWHSRTISNVVLFLLTGKSKICTRKHINLPWKLSQKFGTTVSKSSKVWRILNAETTYVLRGEKVSLQGLSQVKVIAVLMLGIYMIIIYSEILLWLHDIKCSEKHDCLSCENHQTRFISLTFAETYHSLPWNYVSFPSLWKLYLII